MFKLFKRQTSQGITLLELALSMIIFLVLGAAVANLITTGLAAQMSARVHEYQQTVAMNVIDRIRLDMITAKSVVIYPNGRMLMFVAPNGSAVTWAFNNSHQVTRNGAIVSQSPDPTKVPLGIDCGITPTGTTVSCFQGYDSEGNLTPGYLIGGPVRQLVLNELSVFQDIPSGSGSVIDQEFGAARYRVNQTAFDVMQGTEFE